MGVSLWAFCCAHAHKVGVLRAALSLRCFAALRTAHAPSACLTQQRFDILPCLYTYVCFILFNLDYQVLIRLKIFTSFKLRLLYLVLH
ncbi:MAG: hypothetical protein RML94_09440 [Bacteroidia bacterium]|nr:hypothetical protein [Bacteroidia bacterium]